jgi:hypothetical protein
MIILPRVLDRAAADLTPTNVELLNRADQKTDNRGWNGSQGGSHDTEVTQMMKARLYRLSLVAGVVAVFLEGLGAGLKRG